MKQDCKMKYDRKNEPEMILESSYASPSRFIVTLGSAEPALLQNPLCGYQPNSGADYNLTQVDPADLRVHSAVHQIAQQASHAPDNHPG